MNKVKLLAADDNLRINYNLRPQRLLYALLRLRNQ